MKHKLHNLFLSLILRDNCTTSFLAERLLLLQLKSSKMRYIYKLLPLFCIACVSHGLPASSSTSPPPPKSVYEGEPTQEAEPITELPNELNFVQDKDSDNEPVTTDEDGNVVAVEDDDENVTVSVDKEGAKEKFDDAKQEAKNFVKSDTGKKVGIALVCLFGLALLCCCVGCFMRCRPESKEERESVYVKETVYVEESDEREAASSKKEPESTPSNEEPEPSQWTDPEVYTNPSAEP